MNWYCYAILVAYGSLFIGYPLYELISAQKKKTIREKKNEEIKKANREKFCVDCKWIADPFNGTFSTVCMHEKAVINQTPDVVTGKSASCNRSCYSMRNGLCEGACLFEKKL